jgi:hypothetical protein
MFSIRRRTATAHAPASAGTFVEQGGH